MGTRRARSEARGRCQRHDMQSGGASAITTLFAAQLRGARAPADLWRATPVLVFLHHLATIYFLKNVAYHLSVADKSINGKTMMVMMMILPFESPLLTWQGRT